jgi:P-type Cu2+ transporter
LVALSIGLAYAVSVIETLRGGPEVYFDAAVMFVFFLLVARYVETLTRARAQAAITRAQSLPTTVRKLTPAGAVEVSLHEAMIGDQLLISAGHNVPVDGRLESHAAELDESLLNGEPKAQRRSYGERILAGSIVLGAPLVLTVEALGAATWLAKLDRLVDAAQQSRPALQRRAENWAQVFVLVMIVLAFSAALVWSQIDATRALPVALAVLAAACPCAFALAIPAAQAAAQAQLARCGVLVVRADALERAARIDRVAFDKTGTLTLGYPTVENIDKVDQSLTDSDCLAIAAALERGHRHPIARAFCAHDQGHLVAGARAVSGDGVSGEIDGVHYRLGRHQFADAEADCDDGRVWLACEKSPYEPRTLVAFTLSDAMRVDALACVAEFESAGIESLILSGDASHTVRTLADALRVRRARGDLRPEQKLTLLQAEQRTGHHVMMVGDGVNDAPVLAAADLSIAMGEGAALAQRSADMILLRPALSLLPFTLALAKRTRRVIRQNLLWALAYHVLMLPAALMGAMPPWLAALGMSVSSLLVTLNAARLLRKTKSQVDEAQASGSKWAAAR